MPENLDSSEQPKDDLSDNPEETQQTPDTGRIELSEAEKKEHAIMDDVLDYINDGKELPHPLGIKDLKPVAHALSLAWSVPRDVRNAVYKPLMNKTGYEITVEDVEAFERYIEIDRAVLTWASTGEDFVDIVEELPDGTTRSIQDWIPERPKKFIYKEIVK